MLIMLPYAFSFLKVAQEKIIQTIPAFIFGSSDAEVYNSDTAESLSKTALSTFFYPSSECKKPNGNLAHEPITRLADISNEYDTPCSENKKIYAYDYTFLLSTVGAIVLIYIVFSMSIAVAIRAFKLVILRVVGPVAVLSYISPKSSKEGGMFSSWSKTLINVWLELFIYLAILYFALYAIQRLPYYLENMFFNQNSAYIKNLDFLGQTFFKLCLIYGLLMFAMQAPKFVCDSLGIKSKGLFMKMLGMGAAATSATGGAIQNAASGIKRGASEFANAKGLGGRIKGIYGGIAGGVGGALSGVKAAALGGEALAGDKAKWNSGLDATRKSLYNSGRDIKSGRGIGTKIFGFGKELGGYEANERIKNMQAIVDSSDKLMSYAMGEGAKFHSDDSLQNIGNGRVFMGVDVDGNDIYGGAVDLTASRNEILSAVQHARLTGDNVRIRDQVTGQMIDFGSADGSDVAKLLGDTNEVVGDKFLAACVSDAKHDKSGGLSNLVTTYANAKGISKRSAANTKVTGKTGLKKDKKHYENEIFTAKQAIGADKKK